MLLMVSVWLAGFAPPSTPKNVKLVGERPIAGAAAATVSVTVAVCGVLAAPLAVTVIVAVWVPAVSPVVLNASVTAPESVPLVGVSVSQGASSAAPTRRASDLMLLMVSVWLAGFAPPSMAKNVKLVGERPIAGG